jgi:hypothetical protein
VDTALYWACIYPLLANWSVPYRSFLRYTNLLEKKIAAGTVVAAFTDHHAVTLKLDVDVSYSRRGKGIWKLNIDLINDPVCTAHLTHEWERWKHQKRCNPGDTVAEPRCKTEA